MPRDIQSSIQIGEVSLTRQGLDSPLIIGYTGKKYTLKFQGMVFSHRGNFNVSIARDKDATDPITISYVTAEAQIKIVIKSLTAEPIANVITSYSQLDDAVKNIFTIENDSDDDATTVETGTLTAETEDIGLIRVDSIDEVPQYYDINDPEYRGVSNMFSQRTKPRSIYLYDAKGRTLQEVFDGIDSPDWYALTLTNTDTTTINFYTAYVQTRRKIAAFTTADRTLAKLYEDSNRVVMCVQKDPSKQLAMSLVAENLPKTAGSTHWKFTGNLVGQTADNYTVSELREIRENKGITLEKKGNLHFTSDGFFTNGEKIIDTLFNDHVNTRLEEAFLEYSVNKSKITITDRDFEEVRTTWSSVFKQLKTDSTREGFVFYIAPSVTDDEIRNSYNGVDQIQIDLPTAAEYRVNNVEDVKADRLVFGWRFVKAGTIERVEIVGRAVGRIN